jgi:hypothetical protein
MTTRRKIAALVADALSLIGGLLPGKPQFHEIICYVLPVSSELRQERSFNWQCPPLPVLRAGVIQRQPQPV